MALWGGVFIIYSSFINAYKSYSNVHDGEIREQQRFLRISALVYIFIHFALVLVFGRWANDFVHNKPDMTLIAASIRNGSLIMPSIKKLFDGSSVLTIAMNLLLLSFLIPAIYKIKKNQGVRKIVLLLLISGMLIMVLSFVRVTLHPMMDPTESSQNFMITFLFTLFLANPYPLTPYIAYGLFGIVFGILYAGNNKRLLYPLAAILSTAFVIFGFIGMASHDKSISVPDLFWYYKTHFELGIFFLFLLLSLALNRFRFTHIPLIGWFSRISLTIYMFETLISELVRLPALKFFPNWNQSINGSLLFGAFNVLLWMIILIIWSRIDFKYSLEYWWVKGFNRLGKKSTKLDLLGKTKISQKN